jgi:hypothetical protein
MRSIDHDKTLTLTQFNRATLLPPSTEFITALFVLTALFLGGARLLAARTGDQRPDIPSAQEIAPLIGGGNVIAKVDSSAEPTDVECTYEYARNPDGSRSQNNATLSVTHYDSPAKARSVFDGYVTSSVEGVLDMPSFGSFPILRLEQGDTYTAFFRRQRSSRRSRFDASHSCGP